MPEDLISIWWRWLVKKGLGALLQLFITLDRFRPFDTGIAVPIVNLLNKKKAIFLPPVDLFPKIELATLGKRAKTVVKSVPSTQIRKIAPPLVKGE